MKPKRRKQEMEKDKQKKLLQACALEYKQGMNAPIVKAAGRGEIAEQIIELAKKYNIEIKANESEELLSLLTDLPLNSEIPPEIYLAVARVFAYLYRKQEES